MKNREIAKSIVYGLTKKFKLSIDDEFERGGCFRVHVMEPEPEVKCHHFPTPELTLSIYVNDDDGSYLVESFNHVTEKFIEFSYRPETEAHVLEDSLRFLIETAEGCENIVKLGKFNDYETKGCEAS